MAGLLVYLHAVQVEHPAPGFESMMLAFFGYAHTLYAFLFLSPIK